MSKPNKTDQSIFWDYSLKKIEIKDKEISFIVSKTLMLNTLNLIGVKVSIKNGCDEIITVQLPKILCSNSLFYLF